MAPRGRSFCAQLRLLLWKNWLIKRRKPLSTLFEVVLPVIIMSVLVLARHFQDVTPEGQGRAAAAARLRPR
jgi:hypothetical protein